MNGNVNKNSEARKLEVSGLDIQWDASDDSQLRVELSGCFTNQSISEFRFRVEEYLKRGAGDLILRVEKLFHIDSIGIGVLIFFHTQFNGQGRQLIFESPSSDLKEIFKLTSLDRVLTIR